MRGYSECASTSCAGITTEWDSGPDLSTERWNRVEIWADADRNDFAVAINGVTAWRKTNWLHTSLLLNGHTLDYPNMLDSSARDPSCPASGAYAYDDIFIDFTQARVEIGDAPTWSASRHKEIQIPTRWSDGTISIRVNTGTFTAGTRAYLYVVDAAGAVNSDGVAITIGGANHTIKPQAPSGLKAD